MLLVHNDYEVYRLYFGCRYYAGLLFNLVVKVCKDFIYHLDREIL
jgi:hypothetical protein